MNQNKKRECRMCDRDIPPTNHYPAEHCWICLRLLAEEEYIRYYYYKENRWEEVVKLAGISPAWLDKKNNQLTP